jgi:chaperonin cofactor prefoldin
MTCPWLVEKLLLIEQQLGVIENKLTTLIQQEKQRMSELKERFDELVMEVESTKTVIDSAVVAFQGLEDELQALIAGGKDITPAQLSELKDALATRRVALAEAIADVPLVA